MNRTMLALAGATLAMAGAAAQAQDLAAGKAVFDKFNCASCHGADAKSAVDPAYPTLAGQHADYLVHALKAYKRGASGSAATANVRKNPIMGAFAAQLSDQDINNVAAWLRLSPAIWACGSRGSTPKRCALPLRGMPTDRRSRIRGIALLGRLRFAGALCCGYTIGLALP